jgi:hypothetical protein
LLMLLAQRCAEQLDGLDQHPAAARVQAQLRDGRRPHRPLQPAPDRRGAAAPSTATPAASNARDHAGLHRSLQAPNDTYAIRR